MTPAARPAVILGIDPGTAVTGYGVVETDGGDSLSLLECGVVRTSSDEALPARILEIYEEVRRLIEGFSPDTVSVEDVFQGKNARSALTLGHARGAILLAAALHEIEIAEYTPGRIKKAVTGTGRATKDQVGFMVKKHLRLRSQPSPADAADGVAAALCHCLHGAAAPSPASGRP